MSKSILSPKYHFQIVQTSGRIKIRLKDIVFFHFRSHENRETQTMKKVLHEQLFIKLSVYLLRIMAQNNCTIYMLLLSIITSIIMFVGLVIINWKLYRISRAEHSCCCWSALWRSSSASDFNLNITALLNGYEWRYFIALAYKIPIYIYKLKNIYIAFQFDEIFKKLRWPLRFPNTWKWLWKRNCWKRFYLMVYCDNLSSP